MSYTPTEWANGDIITAEKLNKIEGGIVGSGLLVSIVPNPELDTYTLDKTGGQILSAILNCANVIATSKPDLDGDITLYYTVKNFSSSDSLGVRIEFNDFEYSFSAETLEDYPSTTAEPIL